MCEQVSPTKQGNSGLKAAEYVAVSSLTVTVPVLRSQPTGTTEVRTRRVAAWLDELPRANPQDAGLQMYKALFNQNRLALDDHNRLEVTEVFRLPISSIIETLQERYEDAAIPHSEGKRDTSRFVTRLLTEMAYGYKTVAVNQVLRGKWGDHRDELALALQRSIYHLGQILLNAYIAYQPPAVSVWRDLHRLYQFAESADLSSHPVLHEGAGLPDDRTSVANAYQHVLLLAASDPYSLQHGEAKRLYEILKNVHGSAEITMKVRWEDPVGRFLVSFASDAPPIALAKVPDTSEENHLRVVNALDAIRDLHKLMKKSEKEAQKTGRDSGNIELIRRVGRVWAGSLARRQSHRSMNQDDLPVCAGINATWHFCTTASEEVTDDTSEAVEQTETAQVYLDLASVADGDGLLHPGVSKPATGAENGGPALPDWQESTTYRLQLCHTIDESAGGARLRIYQGSSVQVLVGDVVGMQFSQAEHWKAGVVRWLRAYDEDFVDVGIKFLAPNVEAVQIRPISSNGSEERAFVRALKLPGNQVLNSPESVVLPRGVYGAGDRLEVKYENGVTEKVVPMHIVDRTGSFDQLVVGPPPR